LSEYDFDIHYQKGTDNVVADALSRKIAAITSELHNTLRDDIKKAQLNDPESQKIIKSSKDDDQTYKVQEGLLLHKGRIYVPNDSTVRLKILQESHDALTAGHRGREATQDLISRNYYWPKMGKEIATYVATCDVCQRNKPGHQKPARLLQPLPILTNNWEQISMDFIVQLPKTKTGHDAIVVFVDKLSKMAHFTPTITTATAPETAEIFINMVFKHHGIPQVFICDQDSMFTSNF